MELTGLQDTQQNVSGKESKADSSLLDTPSQSPHQHASTDSEREQFVVSKKGMLTYDDVLQSLGEFGRHQKLVLLMTGMLFMIVSFHTLLSVFTLAVPPHRCALPGLTNDTWEVQGEHHASLLNFSLPPGVTSSYARCHINTYALHYHHNTSSGDLAANALKDTNVIRTPVPEANYSGGNTTTCERYVYDTSIYESTIATQMGLVCDRGLLRSHVQMMLMVGVLVGSQLAGIFSDIMVCQPFGKPFALHHTNRGLHRKVIPHGRLKADAQSLRTDGITKKGRKPSIMTGMVVILLSTFVTTWITSFPLLMAVTFFLGMSCPVMLCPTFVMIVEFVGPSYRKWVGYGQMASWSVGIILLTPLAYGLRDWQDLQLTTSLFILPFLSYFWLLPESPRWLLNRGRLPEAEAIIRKTAHVNGVELPPDLMARVRIQDTSGVSALKVFSSRTLVVRHLILFSAWLVNSLTYYGLSWSVGSLSGSVYINFMLMGVVELVAFGSCVLLLDRIGRRFLNCSLMIIAGVSCTATIFPVLYGGPSVQWVTVLLAMIGKLGIAGSFGTIWVFSSELFPTVIRNSGIGTSSVFARIGGIIAPYIANLSQILDGEGATAVPLVIFGVTSMISGLSLLLLPETLNRQLPETIQDAINMGRKDKKKGLDYELK